MVERRWVGWVRWMVVRRWVGWVGWVVVRRWVGWVGGEAPNSVHSHRLIDCAWSLWTLRLMIGRSVHHIDDLCHAVRWMFR